MLTLAESVFWHGFSAVLRVLEPFRKVQIVEPHARIERSYEWQDFAFCSDCKRTTKHTYIEWVEGTERPTTRECHVCDLETVVA